MISSSYNDDIQVLKQERKWKMDIKKLIDDLRKDEKNTFGSIIISVREELKNNEKSFSSKHSTEIVAKLNHIWGQKTEDEKNEIISEIAGIFSDYDSELHSTYDIEQKILDIINDRCLPDDENQLL